MSFQTPRRETENIYVSNVSRFQNILIVINRQVSWLIDWLYIVYLPAQTFFTLHKDVTFAGEGLQKLGLFSALMVFEQGGVFIVPSLLWHGASVFVVSPEESPY